MYETGLEIMRTKGSLSRQTAFCMMYINEAHFRYQEPTHEMLPSEKSMSLCFYEVCMHVVQQPLLAPPVDLCGAGIAPAAISSTVHAIGAATIVTSCKAAVSSIATAAEATTATATTTATAATTIVTLPEVPAAKATVPEKQRQQRRKRMQSWQDLRKKAKGSN